MFNIFRFKKNRPKLDEVNSNQVLDEILYLSNREDYLGKAALAKHASKAAIKLGEYDKAWSLLHEQKMLYLSHAQNQKWNAKYIFALEGTVSEELANILRLEGKHDQALVHILYWIITSQNTTKRQEKKLIAYLGRCKFKSVTIEDIKSFIEGNKPHPDLATIQFKVRDWRDSQDKALR
ncbi:MAG: hypothetical protein KA099_01745 [Alphaproteobacteria bacterium]|nr:hypothetical protein [Alphaproteobacteria bacterium]MBP7758234.1 hypothetical protein [Alphaproteobacteria bacterium]MBP7761623.1 hypothetical protein [Alphaproteobacteria bacterium]MBP7904025.1 hypothetical protein [Alphaproteobacteria bacterium]